MLEVDLENMFLEVVGRIGVFRRSKFYQLLRRRYKDLYFDDESDFNDDDDLDDGYRYLGSKLFGF